MQKIKWWQVGDDKLQTELLNEAGERLDDLREADRAFDRRLVALTERVAAQAKALERLTVVLQTVVEALGPEERARFEERIDVALAALAPPPPPPPAAGAGDPYRSSPPAAPAAPPPQTTCVRCRAEVPLPRTTICDDGNVCDACFHRA